MSEVLADLSGAIGNKVRRELPNTDLVRRIWNSIKDLRDMHGVFRGGHGEHRAGKLAGQSLYSRRAKTKAINCRRVA